MVIEVTRARVHLTGFRQDCGNHLFDRRFPVTARDPDHRDIKTVSPVRRQLAERHRRILHNEARQVSRIGLATEYRRGAGPARLGNKVQSLEAFSIQSHKQRAWFQCPSIGGYRRDLDIGPSQPPSNCLGNIFQTEHGIVLSISSAIA